MRTADEFPLDPAIVARLEAIDATLAGEPVDPAYAEVAELALLLSAERPQPRPEFAAELDAAVERRFRRAPGVSVPGPRGGGRARSWWANAWMASGGLAAALAAVIAAVIVIGGGGSPSGPPPRVLLPLRGAPLNGAASTAVGASAGASGSPAGRLGAAGGAKAAAPTTTTPGATRSAGTLATPGAARSSATPGAARSSATPGAANAPLAAPATFGPAGVQSVSPPANGRKTIQSAQLALITSPGRIDAVAQEAFGVIGAESGIVRHSTVTATGGSDGYAELQLSVPSGNLAQLMNRLSQLRYAHVGSRTDSSQDVNDQYLVDVRRLADARALRTSLLKRLATATTQAQVDGLRAQIRDAEASIASDEATLASLNKQVNLSQVDVTISAGAVPVGPPSPGPSGFTLGRAAHDAGRVLTVAAGVALIALAALVPTGLVVALVAWIALVLRRRGREQALDSV